MQQKQSAIDERNRAARRHPSRYATTIGSLVDPWLRPPAPKASGMDMAGIGQASLCMMLSDMRTPDATATKPVDADEMLTELGIGGAKFEAMDKAVTPIITNWILHDKRFEEHKNGDAGKFISSADRKAAKRSYMENVEIVKKEWLHKRQEELRKKRQEDPEGAMPVNKEREDTEAAWEQTQAAEWHEYRARVREIMFKISDDTLRRELTSETYDDESSRDLERGRRLRRASLVVAASRALRRARSTTAAMLTGANVKAAILGAEASLGAMDAEEAAALHFPPPPPPADSEDEEEASTAAELPGRRRRPEQEQLVENERNDEGSGGAGGSDLLGTVWSAVGSLPDLGLDIFGDRADPSGGIALRANMCLVEALHVISIDMPLVTPIVMEHLIDEMTALAAAEAARAAYLERDTAKEIRTTKGFGETSTWTPYAVTPLKEARRITELTVWRNPTLFGAVVAMVDRSGNVANLSIGRALCELMSVTCSGYSRMACFRKSRVVECGGLATILVQLNLALKAIREVRGDEEVRARRPSPTPSSPASTSSPVAAAQGTKDHKRRCSQNEQNVLDEEVIVTRAEMGAVKPPAPPTLQADRIEISPPGVYEDPDQLEKPPLLVHSNNIAYRGAGAPMGRKDEEDQAKAAEVIKGKMWLLQQGASAAEDAASGSGSGSGSEWSYSASGRRRRRVRKVRTKKKAADKAGVVADAPVPTGEQPAGSEDDDDDVREITQDDRTLSSHLRDQEHIDDSARSGVIDAVHATDAVRTSLKESSTHQKLKGTIDGMRFARAADRRNEEAESSRKSTRPHPCPPPTGTRFPKKACAL